MGLQQFASARLEQFAKPVWFASFVKSYLALGARAAVSDVHDMEHALIKLGSPEQREAFVRMLHSSPAMDAWLKRRYVPPTYTLESLAKHTPGTLGYAYYRHMTDNGLGQDYYALPDTDDEFSYFRTRGIQTHDMHHALCGYKPDRMGEMGIIHFYLGNYAQLDEGAAQAMMMPALLASAMILNFAMTTTGELPSLFEHISTSFQTGRKADLLIAVNWEEHFHRPLSDLRAEFHVTPASDAYDFAPREREARRAPLVAVSSAMQA